MAAGRKKWVGSTSTDHTADANWDGADNPEATDDLIYDGSNPFVGSSNAFALASANYLPTWNAAGASSGSKISFTTITKLVFSANGGSAFIDATMTKVFVNARNGIANMLELDGTITDLFIVRASGSMTITDGAALTNVYIKSCSSGFRLTIGSSVTGMTRIVMDSGRVDCASAVSTGIGTIDVRGGLFYHTAGAAVAVRESGAGRYIDKSTGTITTAEIDGIHDFSEATFKSKTVTNAILGPNGRIIPHQVTDSITWTNGIINLREDSFEIGEAVNRS